MMSPVEPPEDAAPFPRHRDAVSVDVWGKVFLICWHKPPTLDELPRLLAEARAVREAHGAPLLQLVVCGPEIFHMSRAVLAELRAHMPAMDACFDGHVMVVPAQGFLASAMHAMASTLALAGNRGPGRTKICRTVDAGISALAELGELDEVGVRQRLAGALRP